MLKIRIDMLKIRKNDEIIKLGNFQNTRNPEDLRDPENLPEFPDNFFENFSFPGKLKNREKGKP